MSNLFQIRFLPVVRTEYQRRILKILNMKIRLRIYAILWQKYENISNSRPENSIQNIWNLIAEYMKFFGQTTIENILPAYTYSTLNQQ